MLLTISVTVIAASVVVFVIVFVAVAVQILRAAREAKKLIDTVRTEILPLSQEFAVISKEIKGILESIHRDADGLEEGVTAMRDIVKRLGVFIGAALTIVDGPLVRFWTLASAASQGLGSFLCLVRKMREK